RPGGDRQSACCCSDVARLLTLCETRSTGALAAGHYADRVATHVVSNQVPALVGYNAAESPVLREALVRGGAADRLDELDEVGRAAGSAAAIELGKLAEAHPPLLHTHDRYGNRVDLVVY